MGLGGFGGYWEIDGHSIADAEMLALVTRFEGRHERVMTNYGPIEESCTATDGTKVTFELTGGEVQALISRVRTVLPSASP